MNFDATVFLLLLNVCQAIILSSMIFPEAEFILIYCRLPLALVLILLQLL